ncbi:MAG: DUF3298 domain-containing protein [Planctomycetes bacterium]|nr:DUF3298 domain-containing protein [Planctomycetota bacterium]
MVGFVVGRWVAFLVGALGFVAVAQAQRLEWPGGGTHCYQGLLPTPSGPVPVLATLTLPHDAGELLSGRLCCPSLGLDHEIEGAGIGDAGEVRLRSATTGTEPPACRLEGKFDAVARHFPCTLQRPGEARPQRLDLELIAVERVVAIRQPLAVEWEQRGMMFAPDDDLARAANAFQLEMPEHVTAMLAPGLGMEPTMHEDGGGGVEKLPAAAVQCVGTLWWTVWHRGPRLISLAGFGTEYTGGAHGNSWLAGRTFVARSGKVEVLTLADLAVDDDQAPRLAELLRERLAAQGASDAGSYELPSFDAAGAPAVVVAAGGVRFGFSPYAVGCYAEGCYVVDLSWRDLRGVLRPPAELDGVAVAADATAPRR